MLKYNYDSVRYPFDRMVKKNLGVVNLAALEYKGDVVTQKSDQSTDYHKLWYASDRTDFNNLYYYFVKYEVLSKLRYLFYDEEWLYQTQPTMRFQYPGNLAVGEYHRDRDYNHNRAELNVYVPLTDVLAANTIWIESQEGREDYTPIMAYHNEFVIFNGANLKHGNVLNTSLDTRVSFDFRILLKSKYKPGGQTLGAGKKFEIGDYWSEL